MIEKKEIYGDDLVRLLDAQHFMKPEIDWTDEKTWPAIMNWSKIEERPKTPGRERPGERRSASRPQGPLRRRSRHDRPGGDAAHRTGGLRCWAG